MLENVTITPKSSELAALSSTELSKMKEVNGMFALAGSADKNAIRQETLHGRPHLVIPVIALLEGVFHASNMPFPELMPSGAMMETLESWNGRPVVVDHPSKEGFLISANSPDVHDQEVIGNVFNAVGKSRGSKLFLEAWIDLEKVKKLGDRFSKSVERLQAGEEVEVSTGFSARSFFLEGSFEGKSFERVISHIEPDHLALLSEGSKGAFSWESGAGAPRLNSKRIEGDNKDEEEKKESKFMKLLSEIKDMLTNKKGKEVKKADAIKGLLEAKNSPFKAEDQEYLEGLEEDKLQQILVLASIPESEEDRKAEIDAAVEKRLKEDKEAADLKAKEEGKEGKDKLNLEEGNKEGNKEGDKNEMTFEELMSKAPKDIKETFQQGLSAFKEKKDSLIVGLIANDKCDFTKESLEAMEMSMLENLAKMVTPVDYSGSAGAYFNRENTQTQIADEPPALDFSKNN